MGLTGNRRLLRNPQLRTLMATWTAFQTGTFAHSVLIVVFTFSAGGVAAAGAATVLRVLPGGLLGPLAGALANSPRPQLHLSLGIGARCVAMVATVGAVLGGAPVGVVLGLVAADSLMAAAVRPLHGALVVRLADTAAEAAAANAATSSLHSFSALVGPALAGLAVGLAGVGLAFVVPAAAFVAGTTAALLIRVPAAEDARMTSTSRSSSGYLRSRLSAIGAGFRAIVHKPPAAASAVLYVLNTALVGLFCVASASVANDRLRLGAGGITTIMTLYGAGGFVGALAIMSIVGRGHLARVVSMAMGGWALTLAAIGETAVPAAGLALATGCGAAGAIAFAVSPTLVQRSVAREAMVPAAASLQSLYQIAQAAGAMIAPLLIGWFGIPAALATVGGSVVVITALAWPQSRWADALSAEDAAKLAVIRTVPTLAPLSALALEQLARAAAHLAVPAGAEVIRQGDPGDRFYMIAEGLVDVTVDGRWVSTLGPGGSFGEIALLRDVARSATVTARQNLDLVVVDRAEFIAALSGDPNTGDRLGRAALARLDTTPAEERLIELDRDAELAGRAVTELLAAQPPLATIGANGLRELADAARVVAVPDAATIVREGDYGSTYYVILEGAAQVFEDDTPVNDLGPGDGFGEKAILRDIPRTATVRAVGDTKLLAIDRDAFQHARQAEEGAADSALP
jgi:CRP-like cAMP-binding protein/predicted MFS family arabinose efflux permease